MKWDNDPYQKVKQIIFDVLRIELPKEDAEKITIKQVYDALVVPITPEYLLFYEMLHYP